MTDGSESSRRLVIVRHAQAANQPPGGGPDRLRPLTDRGEADARAAARRLAHSGIVVQHIVCSPATRTDRTARIMAEALRYDVADLEHAAAAYSASLGDLLDVIAGTAPDVHTLMLVGHNPALSDLADLLVAGDTVPGLPTCAVVAVDLPIEDWSRVGRDRGTLLYRDFG